MTDAQRALLCDPQTSGGLLLAVRPEHTANVEQVLREQGIEDSLIRPIGELVSSREEAIRVRLR